MSEAQQPLVADGLMPAPGRRRRGRRGGLASSDFVWAIGFVAPYLAILFAFGLYPAAFGLWMGRNPSLYAELASDPLYWNAAVNSALYVGLAVNVKMFLAFLLSGFFLCRGWWIKALLVIFLVPWALPALTSFLSIHWMLNGEWGFLDSALWSLFGIDGPIWLNSRSLALGANIVAYIWKWLPFWTLVFIAGRAAIPPELYEAAAVDGAGALGRFVHVTVPLLANLFLVCTLLSAIWTLGDFTTVYFVSGGAPAMTTDVLATFGINESFAAAQPQLGVAAMMSALPLLIPLAVVLMRKVQTTEMQL